MLRGSGAAEIYKSSIFLTHWGRRDADHKSNTAFTPDNYTQEYLHPMQENGWLHLIEGHPCYTPGKVRVPSLERATLDRSQVGLMAVSTDDLSHLRVTWPRVLPAAAGPAGPRSQAASPLQ